MFKDKIKAIAASRDVECIMDKKADTVVTAKHPITQFVLDFSSVLISVICASLIVWKVLASPDIDAFAKSLNLEAQTPLSRETSFLRQLNHDRGMSFAEVSEIIR